MNKILMAVITGSLWFTCSAFGQTPGTGPAHRAQGKSVNCPCDRRGPGMSGTYGSGAGQGRMKGPGRQARGMGMRNGMGRGNGARMRMMNPAPTAQPEPASPEKK